MTCYASGLAVLWLGLALTGRADVAAGLAIIVLGTGLTLRRAYRQRLDKAEARRPRKCPDAHLDDCEPPRHRARLDKVVLSQWLASSAGGAVSAVGVWVAGGPPFHAGDLVQALTVGASVALTAVFCSSLVDWYWILPRIGGIGGPAPCEDPGGEQWKYPTAIWLFHRGAATTLVVAVIAGVPIYLIAQAHDPGTAAVLAAVAAALGGAVALINTRGIAALTHAFNQPIYVGDTIYVDHPGERENDPRVRRRAYVVDVSIQGLKYKLLVGDKYEGPAFVRKGHGPVDRDDEVRAIEVDRPEGPAVAPCREGCSGVNWYCRCNEHAYDH